MTRRRKVALNRDENKENSGQKKKTHAVPASNNSGGSAAAAAGTNNGPMYTIMSNAQLSDTLHKKYIKEMQQLYTKMDHDAFMFTFIKMLKTALLADEDNEYATTSLQFCAKFISSYNDEVTHPIIASTFKWLLDTTSQNPHIRFRICEFVNRTLTALGSEAALDDEICDRILTYMTDRLLDTAPSVRVQAILAMQRLQLPENPDDPVLRVYQFHLSFDPSTKVRQAVITCMGRNYHTIPYILERLWDIDDKVRRHTYIHMSSYPVRSYKVAQRLTLLEQGLNDRSEAVRKVVKTVLLQQWLESYQKDYITFIKGLKLDASEAEMERFRKVTKQTLDVIFGLQEDTLDFIKCLPLNDEDDEFHHCVPFEQLSIETALYWEALSEFLMNNNGDEYDLILPELSVFCKYAEKFCEMQNAEMDKFERMELQYILRSLMEIINNYDIGEEIGRIHLQNLLGKFLRDHIMDEKIIEVAIRCLEKLVPDLNARMQFLIEIIKDVCGINDRQSKLWHNKAELDKLLADCTNTDLHVKISSLQIKLVELEEQERIAVEGKEYSKLQQITEMKNASADEFMNLLKTLNPLQERRAKSENILKGLQIMYHMVVSEQVTSLTPEVCELYNSIIYRQFPSKQIAVRDWALKCGTAYSMLYEPLAKDVFEELRKQFYRNHNIRLWETAITAVFELSSRYGLSAFGDHDTSSHDVSEQEVATDNKAAGKKSGRQLYNTQEMLLMDDHDSSQTSKDGDHNLDVLYMMSHFLDTCEDTCIISAIVTGFCKLILRGLLTSSEVIEKLLLRYFNPMSDAEVNQILGAFLEQLIAMQKQHLLQPSILPTIRAVLSASNDSPLREIRPETISRFLIDATRAHNTTSPKNNSHNKIAISFLQEMLDNVTNRDLCKLLSKDLLTLEVNLGFRSEMKNAMIEMIEKLIKTDLDIKIIRNVIHFKDILDGKMQPNIASADQQDSDDDDDTTIANRDRDGNNLTPVTNSDSQDTIEGTNSANSRPVITVRSISHTSATSTLIDDNINSADDGTLSGGDVEAATSRQTEAPNQASESIQNSIDNISPSKLTPTTFGALNQVGQHYLRRSLNTPRTQSESEANDASAPSTPSAANNVARETNTPKIRIEVRIDSSRKTTPTHEKSSTQHEITPTRISPHNERATRRTAKKNLANKFRSNDETEKNVDKEVVVDTINNEADSNTPSRISDDNSATNRNGRIRRNPKISVQPPTPRARGRRRANKPDEEAANKDDDSKSDDDDDIIPASPDLEFATPSRVGNNTRRLRQAGSRMATRNANNSLTTPKTVSSTRRNRNLSATQSSEDTSKSNSTSRKSGALENRSSPKTSTNVRKRVFQKTPKIPTARTNSDSSNSSGSTPVISPQRKQQRLKSPPVNSKTSPSTSSPGDKNLSPKNNKSSPQNKRAGNNRKSLPANSQDSVTRNDKPSDSEQNNSTKVSNTKAKEKLPEASPKNKNIYSTPKTTSNPNSNEIILTRTKARKQYEFSNLMTRQRSSLTRRSSTSTSRASSTDNGKKQKKKKVPSKIPVRKASQVTQSTSRNHSTTSDSDSRPSVDTTTLRKSRLPTRIGRPPKTSQNK